MLSERYGLTLFYLFEFEQNAIQSHIRRLVGKHGIKIKAAVAVQRKLLELIYTLYKNNIPL